MADIAAAAALTLLPELWSSIIEKMNLEKDVPDDMQSAQGLINRIRALLNDSKEGTEGSQISQDRERQIRDIAKDIEDAIDGFMFSVPHHFHGHKFTELMHTLRYSHVHKNALNELSQKMKVVWKKIENVKAIDSLGVQANNTNIGEGSSSSWNLENPLSHKLPVENEMLGFNILEKQILDELLSGEIVHSLISVVGPPGSGKTTLVRNIYESKEVQGKFDCLAWVQVSRRLNLEKILRSILLQFCEGIHDPYLHDTAAMWETLNRYFRHKSYVVVLDDIWSKQDCDCITNKLPTSSKCSRIIITSRISDVASSCHHRHVLKELPSDISWNLFCKKAFPTGNRCPPELKEWANKIVRKCEGLPLAVVALGSILSQKGQTPREWKKVYDGPGVELPIISNTLLPSYTELPSDLKSCFLYFSIFPEDYSIPRGKLIRLWTAEGFVVQPSNRTLEEAAEDNLNKLIQRNLVRVCEEDVDGRVRRCRVPYLVHEFITRKAEESKFVKILPERSIQYSMEQARRLSVGTGCDASSLRGQKPIDVRSAFLFVNGSNDCLSGFKLLKVLDMQGSPIESFPMKVIKLALLRYLSLRGTNISSVPKSIKKLTRLETLDLRQTNVSSLPKSIFQLRYLRHLLVYCKDAQTYATFNSVKGAEIHDSITSLRKSNLSEWSGLQNISLVKANALLIRKLDNLINLRKLGLIDVESNDGKTIFECIQKMKYLLKLDIKAKTENDYLELDFTSRPGFEFLQGLYLKGRLSKLPGWVHALHSLIKVRLMWSRLNSSPLQVLETLPNIMELELIDAYTKELLEFKANTFMKLKKLQIHLLSNLDMMRIEESAMPNLEKLILGRCRNLKVSPFGINYLKHLEKFIVYDMPTNFISRLRIMGEDRWMVDHVREIHHHHYLGDGKQFLFEDLSPNPSTMNSELSHFSSSTSNDTSFPNAATSSNFPGQ